VTLAAQLERHGNFGKDLAVECTDVVARRLTEAMWRRARALAADGRLATPLPADVTELGRELPPAAIVEVLAAVVAAGFVYDPGALARGWVSRLGFRMRRMRRALSRDGIDIASQATAADVSPVVCLEFATAMRVLFYALKRATAAPANVFLPVIIGGALDFSDPVSHAWNWLVDADAGTISAFDVTAFASRRAPMHEIDLSRYRNASALLGSAYALAWGIDPAIGYDDVGELLQATIDPETERGLVLLYHLADHPCVPMTARARIAAHLAACDLARSIPEWRDRLAERERVLGRVGRLFFEGDEQARTPLEWVRLRR
jgi:hypothetical protein